MKKIDPDTIVSGNQSTKIIGKERWHQLPSNLLRSIRRRIKNPSHRGMYEVLDYESTLELNDKLGESAFFHKREKVRYLQNSIIAYQDQAWGDGDILLNYRCTPGIPVDRHRPGYTTYILISLRDIKNKGDIDEFNIEWGIRNGFLRSSELWETEVNHPTDRMTIQVIFPKVRPPLRVYLTESTNQFTRLLGNESLSQAPDGRWLIKWDKLFPQLNERYIIQWEW